MTSTTVYGTVARSVLGYMGFTYIEWSLDLGLPGLGILSFTEAVIQPIPPEALTLPMYIEAQGQPIELFLI